MLDALRALQNEGTRGDVAQNFREQGNEAAREKRWIDAKEFYTKGIAVLKSTEQKWDKPEDEEEEQRLRREVEEASYINRALCNLELSMQSLSYYRRLAVHCGRDETNVWMTRELPIYDARLCFCLTAQPAQCQGLLPLRDGVVRA